MNAPREILNECASVIHQAVLKPLGYRKSGFNWVLAGEWTRIINIQLSRWNSADDIRFTINFGVFIEQLHQLAERPRPSATLTEPDCIVRARYGSLTPSRLDHWWEVSSQTDVPELVRDVTGALVSYGLPWFDSFTDFRSLGAEYERQKDMFMASLAYYLADDLILARTRMAAALANANKHFKPRAERIAASLTLSNDG
jgi:hypothetical protein